MDVGGRENPSGGIGYKWGDTILFYFLTGAW